MTAQAPGDAIRRMRRGIRASADRRRGKVPSRPQRVPAAGRTSRSRTSANDTCGAARRADSPRRSGALAPPPGPAFPTPRPGLRRAPATTAGRRPSRRSSSPPPVRSCGPPRGGTRTWRGSTAPRGPGSPPGWGPFPARAGRTCAWRRRVRRRSISATRSSPRSPWATRRGARGFPSYKPPSGSGIPRSRTRPSSTRPGPHDDGGDRCARPLPRHVHRARGVRPGESAAYAVIVTNAGQEAIPVDRILVADPQVPLALQAPRRLHPRPRPPAPRRRSRRPGLACACARAGPASRPPADSPPTGSRCATPAGAPTASSSGTSSRAASLWSGGCGAPRCAAAS
jgi:hypothetical protein